jgi:hypothetical protein
LSLEIFFKAPPVGGEFRVLSVAIQFCSRKDSTESHSGDLKQGAWDREGGMKELKHPTHSCVQFNPEPASSLSEQLKIATCVPG